MDRVRQYERRVRKMIDENTKLSTRVFRKMKRHLEDARERVVQMITNAQGWNAYYYQQYKQELDNILAELERVLSNELQQGLEGGFNSVEEVLRYMIEHFNLNVSFPVLTLEVLGVSADYSADLVKGLTSELRKRLNLYISQTCLGQMDPYQLIKLVKDQVVDQPLTFGAVETRAEAIARTEIARVYNTAQRIQIEKLGQAMEQTGLQLKKMWVHSHVGKNPRPGHLALDGKKVDYKDYFVVGGHKAWGPHDPGLPASEVVNCGCGIVPMPEIEWVGS